MNDHTFLFADLAGFTMLTELEGDEDAADTARRFFDGTRRLLPQHGAEEVKTIGDAMMIRCDHAAPAIRLGIRLAYLLGGTEGIPGVRIGMNTGRATRRGDDWFGAAVNVAARVSAVAAGREVLLTQATQAAAGELDDIAIEARGERWFKHVSEPVRVFNASLAGEMATAGMPVDPICRQAVDPDRSLGRLRHDGVDFYFCSLECACRFAADPERIEHPRPTGEVAAI